MMMVEMEILVKTDVLSDFEVRNNVLPITTRPFYILVECIVAFNIGSYLDNYAQE